MKCFGLQKTNTEIYYCLGRPNLYQYQTLHITIQKEILHPIDVYMDMKTYFIYYENKYKLANFVKINNSYKNILSGFQPL